METIKDCPKCAANLAPNDFVCDYCGYVIFERVKNTDHIKTGITSFENGLEIIQENLNALHDIPKPSAGKTLKAAIRLFLALYTFGVILIFWRRPKKRFIKENFDKLKTIIRRNIDFLKISSSGSSDLTSRINVLENELNQIDKVVKKGIYSKIITNTTIVAFYIGWLIYIVNQQPVKHSTYDISTYDTLVSGNIFNYVTIPSDTFKITHAPSGSFDEWEILVKLKTKKLETKKADNIDIEASLTITDSKGLAVLGLKTAEIEKSSKNKLLSSLLKGTPKIDSYKFLLKNDFNYPQYMDTLPINTTNFIIQIDTIHLVK